MDVEFPLGGSRRLTVPAEAILNSGERQVVFVDLGDGYLLPRVVQTGERVGDRVVVLDGVSEGERVVASGTFLIDAESQLKSALGTMQGGQGSARPAATQAPPAVPAPAARPPSRKPVPAQAPKAPAAPAGHEHVHD